LSFNVRARLVWIFSAFAVAAPDAVLSKMHQISEAGDCAIAVASLDRKLGPYAE
jgi:hypothetical protein